MCGQVLEHEGKTIYNAGIKEGIAVSEEHGRMVVPFILYKAAFYVIVRHLTHSRNENNKSKYIPAIFSVSGIF